MYKNSFGKLFLKFVDHIFIFTLLLAPFESKLVNYSKCSVSLNNDKNSKSAIFSFENGEFLMFEHSSKAHCVSDD